MASKFSQVFAAAILLAAVSQCVDFERDPVKKKGSGPLFQILRGGKWGYMDRTGRIVVPAQFTDEGDFFEGLAWARLGDKWGYVDEKGGIAIPIRFDGAGDFSGGLAPAQIGRRWGFIDHSGKFIVRPQFQAAAAFHEGLALFEVWETTSCGTKDDAPFRAFRLHNAVPWPPGVCEPTNRRYGFVDRNGAIAIHPVFGNAKDFSEGFAAVRPENRSGALEGYIDKTGSVIIPADFRQAYSFSGGRALVALDADERDSPQTPMFGFIDRRGRLVVPPKFVLAGSFSEGLADVCVSPRHCGYISEQGKFLLPPVYSEAGEFSEGLAFVWHRDEDEGYYIDKAGVRIVAPAMPNGYPFRDGLVISGEYHNRQYVDRMGRVIAPYESQ